MTIAERIIAIAANIACDAAKPTLDTSFDQLGFDSLDCIDFTTAVEDTFDVHIHCGDRISFETLRDVARLVETRGVATLPLAA